MGVVPPDYPSADYHFQHPDYLYVNIVLILYLLLLLYFVKTFNFFSKSRFTVSRYEEIPLGGGNS